MNQQVGALREGLQVLGSFFMFGALMMLTGVVGCAVIMGIGGLLDWLVS